MSDTTYAKRFQDCRSPYLLWTDTECKSLYVTLTRLQSCQLQGIMIEYSSSETRMSKNGNPSQTWTSLETACLLTKQDLTCKRKELQSLSNRHTDKRDYTNREKYKNYQLGSYILSWYHFGLIEETAGCDASSSLHVAFVCSAHH
jgi:hypothetical protein